MCILPLLVKCSVNIKQIESVIQIFCILSFFFKIYLIYLFLAALGLRCCVQAFSSCSEWELLFIAVCGLLVVASLVAEHRL